jgi:hypothetical protein
MYPIATITQQSSSIGVFTNIPQTFTHLQVRAIVHDSGASSPADIALRVGSSTTSPDSGSNYAWHRLFGDGGGAYSAAGTSQSFISCAYCPGSGVTSTIMGNAIIDILDYTNTNKYKTVRSIGGYDANGSGYANLHSGLWLNTAAIQSLQVFAGSGGTSAYNTFQLYGITTA